MRSTLRNGLLWRGPARHQIRWNWTLQVEGSPSLTFVMEQSGDQINPAGNRAHLACQHSCAHTSQAGRARQSPPAYLYTWRRPLWSTEVFKLTATGLPHRQFPCQVSKDQSAEGSAYWVRMGTQGWKIPPPQSCGKIKIKLTSRKFCEAPAGCSAALSWGWGWLFCCVLLYKNQWVNRVKSIVLAFNGQAPSLNST